MPRWPSMKKGKKWTPAQHRKYAATIRAKKAGASAPTMSTTLDVFRGHVGAEIERLTAEIKRLQKVRDLLR